jgi:hypothetical protein
VEQKLFSSPATDFFPDALAGNAFAGTELSSGFIQACEAGIVTGTFDLARKANQVADFSNFLTSFVAPRISPYG